VSHLAFAFSFPSGIHAVPLTSRIHEGLIFSNRDSRTLLDKLAVLLFAIANVLDRKVLLVADAYYASGRLIDQLLVNGHQLITRAKSNAVAYLPAPVPVRRRRGRPRLYGEKVRLKELTQQQAAFTSAPSPVYGENNITLRYRCLDLIWRPAARIVRFVIVRHPQRGTIFLLTTDLPLAPLEILQLYGYRFRIELGFRQAVHVLGAYAYHFWMCGMKQLRRSNDLRKQFYRIYRWRAKVQSVCYLDVGATFWNYIHDFMRYFDEEATATQ
jgi:hypothetical protein